MIIWTPLFKKYKRPLGYLRLLMARHRYFVYYGLGKFLLPTAKPGYQLQLRALRDKYKGRRCFVIGNGPSLNDMDLSFLAGEITIGCNGIYKRFPDWGWKTDFLLFEDTEQTELRGPDLHGVKGPTKMAAIYNAYALGADENTLFFNARRADPNYWDNLHPEFSREFEHIVYLGSTVTYISLQLAFHLGCDPVYVIGVDHSYGKLGEKFPPGKLKITEENFDLVQQCHFDKNYYKIGQTIGVPNVSLQNKAYEKAREVFGENKRRIYNAGKNSMLEAFERVEYMDLFRKGLKILFISHAATTSGAPESLRTLMRHFKAHTDWDIRAIVRKKNGPLAPFRSIAYSQFFYLYDLPKWDKPAQPTRLYLLTRELYHVLRRRHGVREALRELRDAARPAGRQKAWEEDLRDEVQTWRPDVIYSNTAVNGDVIRKLGLENVPVVVHVRELATAFGTMSSSQTEEFRKRPDFFFPVSHAVRAYLHSQHHIPEERMEVAPVALECENIMRLSEAESVETIRKKKLPFQDGDVLIGGVGFLNERKGPDLFVDVAHKVISQVGDRQSLRFVWLGEGPDLEGLEQRCKELGMEDKIVFTGLLSNPYPYIRAFDFVLMTSRDDPFPRVNLEAALFGKPMICFADSGGSREFAADECGLVVSGLNVEEMVGKTIELAADTDLRERLGRNAKQKVLDHYTSSVVGDAVIQTIETRYAKRT